jgi:hypothetical protein
MKHLTNGDQWKKGHAVTETKVFERYFFSQTSSQVLKDSTHSVQVNCVLLSKIQYQVHIHSIPQTQVNVKPYTKLSI